ncbi:MAG TPA: SLC13 family permease [Blastocatellia bacterium]|nr:SLC13 family permease [Blastocatellia bacterium]
MLIALVLILVVVAIVLFSLEFIPLDISALILLSTLLIIGVVSPQEAFAGFGSDTVIMIAGLFVMTSALVKTGVVETMGRVFHRYGGGNPYLLAVLIMVTVALASAFISNTAATAVFLPATIGLARRAKISPSKLLMPLAFASILSSSVTLISTSTNIVISGLLPRYNQPPMGMFELAPVGIPITLAGLIYMFTVGMKLLPVRESEDLEVEYNLREYVTELEVRPDSPLIGKPLGESGLGSEMDLITLGILRDNDRILSPRPHEVLRSGDLLLVEGRVEDIIRVKDTAGLEIHADMLAADLRLHDDDVQLVEVMVLSGSGLRGRSLKEVRFRERFGLTVLAINRRGVTLRTKLSRIPLRFGDVLLLQGTRERIQRLMAEGYFTLLGDISALRPRSPKAKYALAIFAFAIALGTFKVLPFASAMLIGTLLMFLSRTITPEEAYQTIEWRIIILIGSMIAFGAAMENSGAAQFVAHNIVDYVGGAGPVAVLSAFFFLTVILTQPMSNQAAALVLLPVAIQTAVAMNLNPRAFAMMIAVAASCSYLTPLEPSCILVYGPGRYRFVDFFKVGALLTVIIFIIAIVLVPIFWPLHSS